MKTARDYHIPIKLTRGIPPDVIYNLKVGDHFTDHGYSSTSFTRQIANSFHGESGRLEITIPKGFKFLSVPSYAIHNAKRTKTNSGGLPSLAKSEAEAILPRSTTFQVKKIEVTKGKFDAESRVLYVHAVSSSVQPPREKWASTKALAKQAKKEPPSGNPIS
jgi:hypothetical protein